MKAFACIWISAAILLTLLSMPKPTLSQSCTIPECWIYNQTACNCLACNEGFYWTGTYCENCQIQFPNCHVCTDYSCIGCENGYYLNTFQSPLICDNCFIKFGYTCVNCTENVCTQQCSVIPNCWYYDGNCQCTYCNAGFFLNDSTCVDCQTKFPNCHFCSQVSCLGCENGFYWKYWESPSTCESCAAKYGASCLNCTEISCTQNCTTIPNCQAYDLVLCQCNVCNAQFQYNGSDCVSNFDCILKWPNCHQCSNYGCLGCKNGFYMNLSHNPLTCDLCSTRFGASCANCTDIACTICAQGQAMVNNTCIPSNNSCTVANCKTCNSSICLSCNSQFYLLNNICYQPPCPSGQFPNAALGTCVQCQAKYSFSCQNCTSDFCTACIPGFNLINNVCTDSCEIGYEIVIGQCKKKCLPNQWRDYAFPSFGECANCTENCLSCANSYYCQTCEPGQVQKAAMKTFWLNASYSQEINVTGCVLKGCDVGFFKNSKGTCEPCQLPCTDCQDLNRCTQCNSPSLEVINGKCVATCLGGSFRNSNGDCENCSTNCLLCNSSSCMACLPGQSMINGVCHENTCDAGEQQSEDLQICQNCSENCGRCVSKDSCQGCAYGFELIKLNIATLSGLPVTICKKNCASNQLRDQSGLCVNCSVGCSYCITKEKCLTCNFGLSLKIVNNSVICEKPSIQCLPNQQYESGACVDCPATCSICSSKDKCTRCLGENELVFYNDKSQCKNCSAVGLRFFNGKCITFCAANQFFDTISGLCLNCSNKCLSCINETACSNCQTGLFLNDKLKCISNCPSGWFTSIGSAGSFCMKCNLKNCTSCSSLFTCTECMPGLVQYLGECISSCPKGTKANKNNECVLPGNSSNNTNSQDSTIDNSKMASAENKIKDVLTNVIFKAQIQLQNVNQKSTDEGIKKLGIEAAGEIVKTLTELLQDQETKVVSNVMENTAMNKQIKDAMDNIATTALENKGNVVQLLEYKDELKSMIETNAQVKDLSDEFAPKIKNIVVAAANAPKNLKQTVDVLDIISATSKPRAIVVTTPSETTKTTEKVFKAEDRDEIRDGLNAALKSLQKQSTDVTKQITYQSDDIAVILAKADSTKDTIPVENKKTKATISIAKAGLKSDFVLQAIELQKDSELVPRNKEKIVSKVISMSGLGQSGSTELKMKPGDVNAELEFELDTVPDNKLKSQKCAYLNNSDAVNVDSGNKNWSVIGEGVLNNGKIKCSSIDHFTYFSIIEEDAEASAISKNLILIICCSAGGFALVVGGIILFCCQCKKARVMQEEDSQIGPDDENGTLKQPERKVKTIKKKKTAQK